MASAIDKALDFFAHPGDKVRLRGNVNLHLHLENLEKEAAANGIDANNLDFILDAAAGSIFPESVKERLVRCLIPRTIVPSLTVEKTISWICTNKPSLKIQCLLLKWLLVVYDLIDNLKNLRALYAFIFHFVESEILSPYACHLLHQLTQRKHVVFYRAQRLLALQRRVGIQPHIQGLLSVYKLYRPDLISISIPASRRMFFPRPDKRMTVLVQDAVMRQNSDLNSDKKLGVSVNSSLPPMAKRRKKCIQPVMKPAPERYEMPGLQQADNLSVSICTVKTFRQLMHNLHRIEAPAQIASVLDNELLQHIILVHPDPTLCLRFKLWLNQTIYQEFFIDFKKDRYKERDLLLAKLVAFSEFIQEGIPVVEYFLIEYLKTWDGKSHRCSILKLITRFRLYPYPILKEILLDPIRRLFFCSSIYFKCSLVITLTTLLKNYASTELPRHRNILEKQKLLEMSTKSSTGINARYSLFEEEVDDFDGIHTLKNLVKFSDSLFSVGLMQERNNYLLMTNVLRYYENVAKLHKNYGLKVFLVPDPSIIVRAFLSGDPATLHDLCHLLISYKEAHSEISAYDSSHTDVLLPSSATKQLNGHLVEICSSLWRRQAFPGNPIKDGLLFKTCSLEMEVNLLTGCGPEESWVIQFQDLFPDTFKWKSCLNLFHHPALKGFIVEFRKETLNATETKEERHRFLEFLEEQGLDAFSRFIQTFFVLTKSSVSQNSLSIASGV